MVGLRQSVPSGLWVRPALTMSLSSLSCLGSCWPVVGLGVQWRYSQELVSGSGERYQPRNQIARQLHARAPASKCSGEGSQHSKTGSGSGQAGEVFLGHRGEVSIRISRRGHTGWFAREDRQDSM